MSVTSTHLPRVDLCTQAVVLTQSACAAGRPPALALAASCTLPRLSHWVVHALLLSPAQHQQPPAAATARSSLCASQPAENDSALLAALALTDNSVELWRFPSWQPWQDCSGDAGALKAAAGARPPAEPPGCPPSPPPVRAQPLGEQLLRVVCDARVMLCSAHLWAPQRVEGTGRMARASSGVWVAAGTMFGDALVWFAPLAGDGSSAADAAAPADTISAVAVRLCSLLEDDSAATAAIVAASLQGRGRPSAPRCSAPAAGGVVRAAVRWRLRGHEGAVHCVRWSSDGCRLLTGSDDRTLRVWQPWRVDQACSSTAGQADCSVVAPRLTLWGHSARLWDCAAADDLLISCSEDGTVRLWSDATGRPLEVRAMSGDGCQWSIVRDTGRSAALTDGPAFSPFAGAAWACWSWCVVLWHRL